jgi:hypothetical protein
LDARSSGVVPSKIALSRKSGSSSVSPLFSISSDFFKASLMYWPREILSPRMVEQCGAENCQDLQGYARSGGWTYWQGQERKPDRCHL